MGVGGERHASAALPPTVTRCALYRSLSGRVQKILPPAPAPTGFDPPDHPARSESILRNIITSQPLTTQYSVASWMSWLVKE